MTFSLTILGSSSALPTSQRHSTAQVLNILERFFLIDCGEGTQIQLRRYKIKLSKINHVFISHLHGDHVFGLFGLISTFNLMGRNTPLHIYAHKELKKILKNHFLFFDRIKDFEIIYHVLNNNEPEMIYDDKSLTVQSFPLLHRIPCCGFLFNEKKGMNHIRKEKLKELNIPIKEIVNIKNGSDFKTDEGKIIKNDELTFPAYSPRTYAFCSDTLYNENIPEIIKGVDLLYHESTFTCDQKKRAIDTFHSTATDAAKIALKSQAGHLILGHFSARYKDLSVFKKEANLVFPHVEIAEDGVEFKLDTSHILKKINLNV